MRACPHPPSPSARPHADSDEDDEEEGAAAAAAAAALGSEGDESEEGGGGRVYPDPPQREWALADLLRAAGLDDAAGNAPPGLVVRSLVTINSPVTAPPPDALLVCVPPEGREEVEGAEGIDGHELELIETVSRGCA